VRLSANSSAASQQPAPADFLGNLAEKRVREVLNVSVLDILLRAWEKCRVVAEALEATRNSPGTTEMVELLEHEVATTEHPELYISSWQVDDAHLCVSISRSLPRCAVRYSRSLFELCAASSWAI
jgi:hypothetical protein